MTAIRRGMVLAAGLGTRMRPLTDSLPKPLVAVAGETLIDRILDRMAEAGVEETVVNLHHKADQLSGHLARRDRPRIVESREETLLETGGGVRHALALLGPDPFFVVNGDILWRNGKRSALDRLAGAWDEGRMDALLLLQRTVSAVGYDGRGDFMLSQDGSIRRPKPGEIPPYLFAGIQVLHPRLFAEAPDGPFSLNRLYDRAAEAGRLGGLVHDGEWYHVGTPQALADAEEALATQRIWL
ncbi:MurNAc alpha-1-phosphate uridylyltransferase [Stella humosa]|uniref:MurNAc alpha-1-phosphate uridylyltransferase n=1 Tax=Stella humosa TaxID=94 RepID=A0A3N1LGP9_9PROT|nr:nucleotidyltransferase family protein [Stella humosa]ROP90677.1 MurNAc alpha-1-phosphate uridylyltransferase [Stella humosa]BBK29424.1 mannose-1-phosphate guanylyltransferase [Stella humosa]